MKSYHHMTMGLECHQIYLNMSYMHVYFTGVNTLLQIYSFQKDNETNTNFLFKPILLKKKTVI